MKAKSPVFGTPEAGAFFIPIPMLVFPNCKINLGLHVVSKRSDGYHDLETCFYPVAWHDALELIPSDRLSFRSIGIDIPEDGNQNLCLRAYQLLAAAHTLPPIEIILQKLIPIGAGLGGGSADAAFMLKALNERYQLALSDEQLEAYALQLGSDCPFFIKNKAVIAKGRGEQFEDITLDLSQYYLLLINPGIHVGTAQAYAGVKPATPAHPLREVLSLPVRSWPDHLVNDFEPSVFVQFPDIGQWKEWMYEQGASYAAMSGSGATVFGLFEQQPAIDELKSRGAQQKLSYHLVSPKTA